jgi:hypothetical protein
MIYATAYGYKNGRVHALTAPVDADLNLCGFGPNGELSDYPKMVFSTYKIASTTAVYTILKSGVCVKECPAKG